MSRITTHILDTSIGKPAQGVSVLLEQKNYEAWKKIAEGTTNTDGRINDLLSEDKIPGAGIYRLVFETASYFKKQNVKTFYPLVTIEFEITGSSHYHVPLLLSPYGYSTYKGS